MTIRAKTATVTEELVDYDGLQLLLLKTDRKRHMLAMAIKREKMDEPFFCCEITDKVYDSYFYALFVVLHRIGGRNNATERGFIRKAIQDRFWRGGGSYLGFYDDLMERNRLLSLSPLEVAKIQYASPGVISLRGDRKVLSDINDIIEVFDEKWEQLALTYKNIHGTLQKEN